MLSTKWPVSDLGPTSGEVDMSHLHCIASAFKPKNFEGQKTTCNCLGMRLVARKISMGRIKALVCSNSNACREYYFTASPVCSLGTSQMAKDHGQKANKEVAVSTTRT